jgi:two-component system cell cycle response regulator CpdR
MAVSKKLRLSKMVYPLQSGFIVCLPRARQYAAAAWLFFFDERQTRMTVNPSRLPLTRILLAEDDDSMRGFLERALRKAGHDVVSFDNGADAFERIQYEPFTLLLTDIVMPKMDGIELARRASELDPELKIMFITGFAAVTLTADLGGAKDASVLSKPFHLKDLVREVERLISE